MLHHYTMLVKKTLACSGSVRKIKGQFFFETKEKLETKANKRSECFLKLIHRLIDEASDVPSIISFHNFSQNSLEKSFQFIFLFFHNFAKIKINSFECPKSIRNYEKK